MVKLIKKRFQIITLTTLVLTVSAGWRCGRYNYPDSNIDIALRQGCTNLFKNRKQVGTGTQAFPHEFFNRGNRIKMNGSGPYYEFPVMRDGKIYNGSRC
jgi:hypothetical protein